jgi:uncharacterized protein YlzI (FlbEa/FlbD family)
VIEVKRLDGTTMHMNEDLIARVEHAAGGHSAVYMLDGGHIIVADNPSSVVNQIRDEKVEVLRRVFRGPDDPIPRVSDMTPGVTRLSQVKKQ